MQLDKTQIAIRERGMLEILDLSLHVLRVHAAPLTLAFLLGIVPLAVINHLLAGWMMPDFESGDELAGGVTRYIWIMSAFIFLEAPLMSVFATFYLGRAAFLERPSIEQTMRETRKMAPQLAWCHLMLRGVAPAWLLVLTLNRDTVFEPMIEAFLLPLLVLCVAMVRSVRPYLNEVILLERNPLRSADPEAMTIGRRSRLLHSPSSADLSMRWMGYTLIAILLTLSVFGVFLFSKGVLFNNWSVGQASFQFLLPLSMWIVAAFTAVVRYLSYLDLRIRHEGWEVELRLRAEAARLESRLKSGLV